MIPGRLVGHVLQGSGEKTGLGEGDWGQFVTDRSDEERTEKSLVPISLGH